MATLSAYDILRLRLLSDGVFIDRSARDAWRERVGGPFSLREFATTNGVTLVLPGIRYVNAPMIGSGHVSLPRLSFVADGFVVTLGRREVPVEVVPVAEFHHRSLVDRMDGRARPMSTYGVTHTDRCRVSPIAGCSWKCQFCNIPFELDYRKKHVDDLLEVITAAKHDPRVPAWHVLVSGGTPHGGRGRNDEEWLDSLFAELAERSALPVEIMMAPRRDDRHPERLRRAGVNALSINLEMSDPARASVIVPQKARYGRTRLLRYIERAIESFGVGSVQSLVVFGSAIESSDSTLEGVRDLVARGCIPVLSPFRAHPATPMGHLPSASFDEMRWVYECTLDICESAGTGVLPGPRCVPCHHNVVAAPLDELFYRQPTLALSQPCVAC